MVDYLCLKLSKTTEEVLDIPYFDCKRKLETYRAIEQLEQSLPIIAYPILGEEGGRAATQRVERMESNLKELIGIGMSIEKMTPETMEQLTGFFEEQVGEELISIEDLIKGR